MDSLGSILGGKNLEEPPQSICIKRYVETEFKARVGVQVRERDIIISVQSAALANTLRLRGPDIKRHCQITQRLTFRIG
jgi:hypothetical protein